MAKYSSSNWGTIKNKLGDAVGKKWNGLKVVTVYQPEVSNPRTNAQQRIRARFGALAALAKVFKAILADSLKPYNKIDHSTAYANFVKLNWDNATASSPDSVSIDYTKLQISKGDDLPITVTDVDFGEDEHLCVTVTYTPPSTIGDFTNSAMLYVVAYNALLGKHGSIAWGTNLLEAGSATVEVPASWNGMDVKVYAFSVHDAETSDKLPTTTVFCGGGTIA